MALSPTQRNAWIGGGATTVLLVISLFVFGAFDGSESDTGSTENTSQEETSRKRRDRPETKTNESGDVRTNNESNAGTSQSTQNTKTSNSDDSVESVTSASEESAERITDAQVVAWLREHKRLFTGGDFTSLRLRELEASLAKAQPVRRYDSFQHALSGTGRFLYRTRLLTLLDGRSSDTIWSLFESNLDRYRKSPSSLDWGESELDFLRTLMRKAVSVAHRQTGGIATLRSLSDAALLPRTLDQFIAGLREVPQDHRAAFEPMLREFTFDSIPQLDHLRDYATLLLEFQKDEDAKLALINDERLKPIQSTLFAKALESGLIAKDKILPQIEQTLRSARGDSLPRLVNTLAKLDRKKALQIARSLTARNSLNADFEAALLKILAMYGSSVEVGRLVSVATERGGKGRRALDALIAAGKTSELEQVYGQTSSVPIKVIILSELTKGEDGEVWLERGISADQPSALRLRAVSMLDASTDDGRDRLKSLASADDDPQVRERALQSLGKLEDISLVPFFEGRAADETQARLKTLAKGYAAQLQKLKESGS